jgi:hypothetical protein
VDVSRSFVAGVRRSSSPLAWSEISAYRLLRSRRRRGNEVAFENRGRGPPGASGDGIAAVAARFSGLLAVFKETFTFGAL